MTCADMIQEVFMAEKNRWEGQINEAQSVNDAAEQDRATKKAAKDAEDAKVAAQKAVVKELQAASEKAEEVIKECEEEVEAATTAHSKAKQAQEDIRVEQEKVLAV